MGVGAGGSGGSWRRKLRHGRPGLAFGVAVALLLMGRTAPARSPRQGEEKIHSFRRVPAADLLQSIKWDENVFTYVADDKRPDPTFYYLDWVEVTQLAKLNGTLVQPRDHQDQEARKRAQELGDKLRYHARATAQEEIWEELANHRYQTAANKADAYLREAQVLADQAQREKPTDPEAQRNLERALTEVSAQVDRVELLWRTTQRLQDREAAIEAFQKQQIEVKAIVHTPDTAEVFLEGASVVVVDPETKKEGNAGWFKRRAAVNRDVIIEDIEPTGVVFRFKGFLMKETIVSTTGVRVVPHRPLK